MRIPVMIAAAIATLFGAALFSAAPFSTAFADGHGEKEKTAYEPMAVFAELAGRSWRGEGTGPDGAPIVDIAKYEMILGGRAFQATHRLESGVYGGRTIIFYDEAAEQHIFHYFTTAGFHTTGVIEPTEKGFSAVETVIGHSDYAEVHSDVVLEGDTLRVASRHVKKTGEMSEGEGMVYREIDDPGPLFFDEADALFGKRTEIKDASDKYSDD
ncbi:MAG: hypothetical protein AAFW81_04560 [Pseudomonadota bacterium]